LGCFWQNSCLPRERYFQPVALKTLFWAKVTLDDFLDILFAIMLISAKYICPVRGLATLEPPEPLRLGQAARVAGSLGVKRFMLPVLEEPLMKAGKSTITYLDGLLQALDQVEEAGVTAWLIAPARRVLGLDWVPPCLVKGSMDPNAGQVFLEGRLRNVWPYNWWEDISVLQRRIKIFRELAAAVSGHPALTGWVIMDRGLEWARPESDVADLVLKSYTTEIRERNESGAIYLGFGWSELLDPGMARSLARQVDGLLISGLDKPPSKLNRSAGPVGELRTAAYLGNLSQWLLGLPTEVEVGWGMIGEKGDPEEIMETFKISARQGLAGASWLSLIDPKPNLCAYPPWVLRNGLERAGLLDQRGEPKEYVEDWLNGIHSIKPKEGLNDFIDISVDEYLDDPQTHFTRLWNRFSTP
jgi:hypothetical protein